MKVLAEANANAAISILHALGLGKGCSIGINLKTTVRLVSEPQKVEGDFHNLLQTIEDIWGENGYPLPEKFGWQIFSEIPIGQGLKSSSAISCAATYSLMEVNENASSSTSLKDLPSFCALFRRTFC